VNETDGDMLWNDSKENGDVRSECEEMKALTVTVIGKGRI
jgi:hypothetical protein